MRKIRYISTILFLCCSCFLGHATAQDKNLGDIERLQKRMYLLYGTTDHQQFLSVTDSLMAAAEAAGEERIFYKAWGNKAIYSFNKIGRSEGLKIIRAMKAYAEQQDNDFGLYSATYAAGTMQNSIDLHDEAEASFLKAIEYKDANFPDESAAACYLGITKIELARKHYDKALEATNKALKEPNIVMQHQLSAWSYKCIIEFETNDIEGFKQAYAEREKVKAAYGQDDNYGPHIYLYYAEMQGDYKKALEIARTLKTPISRMSLTAHELAMLGEYKAAYEEANRLKEHRDTANVETMRKLASEFAIEMDLARAENEAKDLRLENQLQAEHAHHVLMGVVGAAALAVIALLSIIIIRQKRHEQKLEASNTKLQEANDKLTTAYSQLEETTKARERHESELRIARDIQRSMVPMTFPAFPDHREIDLHAFIRAAKGVGGDLYDYSILGDKLYFCLGDVSGKGVPAALFMVEVISIFRTEVKERVKPELIASRMNDALCTNNDNGMFVTMFIGMLDLKTGWLDYCNAGHNPPVFIHKTEADTEVKAEFIEVEPNAPIGLWPELEYVGEHIDSMMNQTLFLYSDGLNEAENQRQEQFSDERVLANLNHNKSKSSQQAIMTMLNEMTAFVNGAEQSDDLTMLCIKLAENETFAKAH